jgi:hypothetical protein
MNSLAITDGILLIATVAIVSRAGVAVGTRLAVAVFAAAAFFGVLRFSTLLPLPGIHMFFSGLGASAGYPLLAASFLWPEAGVAQRWRFASIFLVIAGAFGLVASALEIGLWGNILAVASVLALLTKSAKQRDFLVMTGSVSLLTALLLFAGQIELSSILQPGDFLHLFMALGLTLIAASPQK